MRFSEYLVQNVGRAVPGSAEELRKFPIPKTNTNFQFCLIDLTTSFAPGQAEYHREVFVQVKNAAETFRAVSRQDVR